MDESGFAPLALVIVFSVLGLWQFYRTRRQVGDLRPWTDMGEAPPRVDAPNYKRAALVLVGGPGFFVLMIVGFQWWTKWVRPPHKVYRDSLLRVAVPALHCPAEQLTFEQVDSLGTKVSGCGRSAQFVFWGRRRGTRDEYLWSPDSGCRETFYLVVHMPC
jgi:hypothetical protein